MTAAWARDLRYFAAVGEEQQYGRAAHRLLVTHPALSRQVQDLEGEIGFNFQIIWPAASWSEVECSRQAVPGGCPAHSSACKRRGGVRRSRSSRLIWDAARRIHRECLVAGRNPRFVPAIPGAYAELQLSPLTSLEQSGVVRPGRISLQRYPSPVVAALQSPVPFHGVPGP